MLMAEWSVRVFGPEQQMRAAVECLSGSDWALRQSANEWYMTSTEHFGEESGALFTDQAQHKIGSVNTVYRVFNSNDSALLTLGIPSSYLRTDGTTVHFQSADFPHQIEFGSTRTRTVEGKEVPVVIWAADTIPEGRSIPYAVAHRKSSTDPHLEAVTNAFLSQPDDWTRIANVVELIEKNCGGQIPKTWVSRGKLELLWQTACSIEEAGGTGRHANPRMRAAKHPMPLAEGRQIALSVLRNWFSKV
jgi:hypothetical protein